MSPTINEEWIKEKLASIVAGGVYDENIIRDRVAQISVFQKYLVLKAKNDAEWIIKF